eukprot:TRINITY_DN97592_c0_g1_i1.p2 TRINITY_DN97592_c0_g1~~TRINITY_DN97592_c0_g1_i1.p2  ORF type:complete len:106 (-),score=1.29 TRINITY_DN97592_c0_g1_i1:145-462(-)
MHPTVVGPQPCRDQEHGTLRGAMLLANSTQHTKGSLVQHCDTVDMPLVVDTATLQFRIQCELCVHKATIERVCQAGFRNTGSNSHNMCLYGLLYSAFSLPWRLLG